MNADSLMEDAWRAQVEGCWKPENLLWQSIPVILAPWRCRQEHQAFEASLEYIRRWGIDTEMMAGDTTKFLSGEKGLNTCKNIEQGKWTCGCCWQRW